MENKIERGLGVEKKKEKKAGVVAIGLAVASLIPGVLKAESKPEDKTKVEKTPISGPMVAGKVIETPGSKIGTKLAPALSMKIDNSDAGKKINFKDIDPKLFKPEPNVFNSIRSIEERTKEVLEKGKPGELIKVGPLSVEHKKFMVMTHDIRFKPGTRYPDAGLEVKGKIKGKGIDLNIIGQFAIDKRIVNDGAKKMRLKK